MINEEELSPDELVSFLQNSYPGIFPTREDVLIHLFDVIGNGYDWEDGKLVAPQSGRSSCLVTNLTETVKGRYSAFLKMQSFLEKYGEKRMEEELVEQAVSSTVEDLGKFEHNEYLFMCKNHSKFFTAPKEVKTEWLPLLLEFARLVQRLKKPNKRSEEHWKIYLEEVTKFEQKYRNLYQERLKEEIINKLSQTTTL